MNFHSSQGYKGRTAGFNSRQLVLSYTSFVWEPYSICISFVPCVLAFAKL